MFLDVLQRFTWSGVTQDLGEMFILKKNSRTAVCRLFSHQFGCEVRLMVGDEILRTQVCRTQEEVFTTGEQWKTAMETRGWR